MDLPLGGEEEVLAQPTRARIFEFLLDHRTAASTEEVSRALGLHANGVRRHLDRLAAAGLLERRLGSGGRGRPGVRWTVAPGARPGGAPPRAYADLSRWLARAIPATTAREREAERAGREIGRELAPPEVADPIEGFAETITALGFQPTLDLTGEGGFTCTLANCPYRESVHENPDVVCSLHRGITAGLLDAIIPAAHLVSFVPRDPDRGGCVVGVEGAGRTAASGGAAAKSGAG